MSDYIINRIDNIMVMLDPKGWIAVGDKQTDLTTLNTRQVMALGAFFLRPDVKLRLQRMLCTRAEEIIGAPLPAPIEEPEEEVEKPEKYDIPPVTLATLATGEPIQVTYSPETGLPWSVETEVDGILLAFDLAAEERNIRPICLGAPIDTYLTVADLGRLKELLSTDTLERLITLGRQQDKLLEQRKAA